MEREKIGMGNRIRRRKANDENGETIGGMKNSGDEIFAFGLKMVV